MYVEKRTEKRKLITTPVQCLNYNQEGGAGFSARGITINLSDSGMCFYTHKSLEEGAQVLISGSNIWNNPKKADVRWCKKIMGGLYRVGLTFV